MVEVPGAGKRRGERYRGPDRPFHKLSIEEAKRATDAQLQKWEDGLNDAYDFDAVDATEYHNMDVVRKEQERRRKERSPLGFGVLPIFGFIDRLEGRRA